MALRQKTSGLIDWKAKEKVKKKKNEAAMAYILRGVITCIRIAVFCKDCSFSFFPSFPQLLKWVVFISLESIKLSSCPFQYVVNGYWRLGDGQGIVRQAHRIIVDIIAVS